MGRTILVADDSAAIQKKASGILAAEGLEVLAVSNGVAAIKKLSLLRPLVILADVSMPGKDGYEVCEFVKTNPDLAYLPVLLLVSDLEPYDDHRGAMVRADGMVQKPFDPDTLATVVMKFAARAEAALAHTQVAETVINPPRPIPEFSIEGTPAVEEQAPASTSGGLDWGALPEGSAFGEPAPYEAPSAPPQPAPGSESLPESQYEWASEPVVVTEGRPAEVSPEASVADQTYHGEPAPLEYSPAAAIEFEPEAALAVPDAGYAQSASAEAKEEVLPVPFEPIYVEEPPSAVSETVATFRPETTMIFRAPVEIAEPVMNDDQVLVPPVEEPQSTVEVEVPHVALESDVASTPVAGPELVADLKESSAPIEDASVVGLESAPLVGEGVTSPAEYAPHAEEFVPGWDGTQPNVIDSQPAEESLPESVENHPFVAEVRPPEKPAPKGVEAVLPVAGLQPAEESVADLVENHSSAAEAQPVEAAAVEASEAVLPDAELYPAEEAMPKLVEAHSTVAEVQPAEPAPEAVAAALPVAEPQPANEAVGELVEVPSPDLAMPAAEVATAPATTTSEFDPDWVYWIVRTVVLKMSPAALPSETVEELARNITDEIAAELESYT